MWYLPIGRYFGGHITRFDDRDIVTKNLHQIAKKYFNYDKSLEILFSVCSFEDEYDRSYASISVFDLTRPITDEKGNVKYPHHVGKLEILFERDILTGNTDEYDIWDDSIEAKMDVIPEESVLRPWSELLEEMNKPHINDYFFNSSSMVVNFLPYYYAKRYLKDTFTCKRWDNKERIPYTREGVLNKIKERYYFLKEKIEDNRGLSTCKAMIQLKTLCWLLKDKEPNYTNPVKMRNYIRKKYIDV